MHLRRSDVLFALALAFTIAVAWLLRHLLLLIYVAALLAVVLIPAVDRVRSWVLGGRTVRRGSALALIVAVLLSCTALLARLFLPQLLSQSQALIANAPQHLNDFSAALQRLPGGGRVRSGELQTYISSGISAAVQVLVTVGRSLRSIVIVAVLTGYFVAEGKRTVRWILRMIPQDQASRLGATLMIVEERVSRWIAGQLLLMLFVATADALVYGFFGVNYFLALSLFAGLMNIVPVIGPVIGLMPAVIVAATQSPGKLIAVLAFYGIYQQIDNSFITPRVMRATVKISALAVVVALVLGTALAGVTGAFVAVPTAALIEVFLQEYLKRGPLPGLGDLGPSRAPSAL